MRLPYSLSTMGVQGSTMGVLEARESRFFALELESSRGRSAKVTIDREEGG